MKEGAALVAAPSRLTQSGKRQPSATRAEGRQQRGQVLQIHVAVPVQVTIRRPTGRSEVCQERRQVLQADVAAGIQVGRTAAARQNGYERGSAVCKAARAAGARGRDPAGIETAVAFLDRVDVQR